MMILLLLMLGLVLLYFGAEMLVKGAVEVARRMGVGPLVIGLTVVAFGTSAPELTVSTLAALGGQGDIAMTNVVGSNIFNVAVILGLAALICPIRITAQVVKVDMPLMILASLICLVVSADRYLSRIEGILLFLGITAYILFSYHLAYRKSADPLPAEMDASPKAASSAAAGSWITNVVKIAVGLGLLVAGSKAFVEGAVQLAQRLDIPEAVIGLTIISAGTSLPELATSVVAAMRKQPDIAVGNIVGSNIFNIMAILGISSMVSPYSAKGLTGIDLAVMLAAAVIALPLMWSRFTLSRLEGAGLLAGYLIYLVYLWPK